MISKLSCIITDYFLSEDIIKFEDKEIYEHGAELIISACLNTSILFIVGILTNQIIECVIFYFVFCFMRVFCGGFHANSYSRCTVLFVGILLSVLLFDKLLCNAPYYYWLGMILYSLVILVFLSPIDNPNKPLNTSEKRKYKKRSIIEMLIWFAIALITFVFHSKLYHVIILTLLSVSTLMLSAIIKERGKQNEETS